MIEAAVIDLTAIECVRRLVEADEHRDLVRYRALLHDDMTEYAGGAVVVSGGDAAARVAIAHWRDHPDEHLVVDDLAAASGLVTLRYRRWRPRALPETAAVLGSLADTTDLPGYRVFEVVGGRVRRMWTEEGTEHLGAPRRPRPPSSEPLPDPNRRRSGPAVVLAAAAGSWLVQELVLAAPVVAATARLGAGRTWLVFAPLYATLGLLATVAVLRLERGATGPAAGRAPRLRAWLQQEAEGTMGRLARRLLAAGGILGVALSAYLLGGVVTTWLVRRLGVRRRLGVVAVGSNVVWATGFVAFYSGVTGLIV